jgi:DNA replication regulator SLD3
MLFETPIAPRAAKERLNVVDDTPIKSRLPLGVAGDGGNRNRFGGGVGMGMGMGAVRVKEKGMGVVRVKEKGMGVVRVRETGSDDSGRGGNENGNGSGNGVSIYQQLGWDTTDLDDIDDLL